MPCTTSFYTIPTIIFSKLKYTIVPKIHTAICVSILALSEMLNKVFLGKEQAAKIRQPKSSPSVTDSMVSAPQVVSLGQTQFLHSGQQNQPFHTKVLLFFYILLMLSALPVMPALMPLSSPSQRPPSVNLHA